MKDEIEIEKIQKFFYPLTSFLPHFFTLEVCSDFMRKTEKHENTVLGYKKGSKVEIDMILKSSHVNYIWILTFIFA